MGEKFYTLRNGDVIEVDSLEAAKSVSVPEDKKSFVMGLIDAMMRKPKTAPVPYVGPTTGGPRMRTPYDRSEEHQRMLGMLAMRMRWDRSLDYSMQITHPFKDVMVSELSSGAIIVLVVTGAGYVVLEDEAGMFPSDNLVTKLRILTP